MLGVAVAAFRFIDASDFGYADLWMGTRAVANRQETTALKSGSYTKGRCMTRKGERRNIRPNKKKEKRMKGNGKK
jgi:hypothetical protein